MVVYSLVELPIYLVLVGHVCHLDCLVIHHLGGMVVERGEVMTAEKGKELAAGKASNHFYQNREQNKCGDQFAHNSD